MWQTNFLCGQIKLRMDTVTQEATRYLLLCAVVLPAGTLIISLKNINKMKGNKIIN